jgi:hypothetical protein
MLRCLASHFVIEDGSGIVAGKDPASTDAAQGALQSFLLSFASRAASRERLHVFTTNYDRLIEHGCDFAGLRIIDRFVGALNPVFRASKLMSTKIHPAFGENRGSWRASFA